MLITPTKAHRAHFDKLVDFTGSVQIRIKSELSAAPIKKSKGAAAFFESTRLPTVAFTYNILQNHVWTTHTRRNTTPKHLETTVRPQRLLIGRNNNRTATPISHPMM